MGNGLPFYTNDQHRNLPMNFDDYDEVEIMDLPKETVTDPWKKSKRTYAALSKLALEAGRIGGIPAFSLAVYHALPKIQGFK